MKELLHPSLAFFLSLTITYSRFDTVIHIYGTEFDQSRKSQQPIRNLYGEVKSHDWHLHTATTWMEQYA